MFKKTTLVLTVLAVLLFVESQGTPVIDSENTESIPTAAIRGPRIGPSEWLKFNHNWTFPSLPSVSSLFYDNEKEERGTIHIRRRIDSLERTQKSIIEMLRNLTRDVNVLSAACADKKPDVVVPPQENEKPILPAKPATNKDEIESETQNAAISVEGQQSAENIEQPEATQDPVIIEKPEPPVIPQENLEPSSTSDEKKPNQPQEIPDKIVIASTASEDNPEENPFGNISLVGFAPPQENRPNARMPWNKDSKSNKKALE